MALFSDLDTAVSALRGVLGDGVCASGLPTAVSALSDDDMVAVLRAASQAIRVLEGVRAVAVGVTAHRSRREAGHAGVAQVNGHRTAVSFVQEITGMARGDAAREVRVGEQVLGDGAPAATPGDLVGDTGDAAVGAAERVPERWDAALATALLEQRISVAQHDAIRRGLGAPPSAEAGEAWAIAAVELVAEAARRTVEELGSTARTIRDRLDPAGAEERFDRRFEARSFRLYTDPDGVSRGSFVFDDIGAAQIRTIINSAMRSRTGGPRFVAADERARAEALQRDSRTNDQLTYDLMLDLIGAGTTAEPATVFGTRLAGVRVVTVHDVGGANGAAAGGSSAGGDDGRPPKGSPGTTPAATTARTGPTAYLEETGASVPAWLAAQQSCAIGTLEAGVAHNGDPLYVGRESRLFTAKQRTAMALRDGGCRWPGCDRPASFCEAHHIDAFASGGRTDVDRGILLCRFHHMNLHHHGWRITRAPGEQFWLHPPDAGADAGAGAGAGVGAGAAARPTASSGVRGAASAASGNDAIELVPRLALRYAWSALDPPAKRFIADTG